MKFLFGYLLPGIMLTVIVAVVFLGSIAMPDVVAENIIGLSIVTILPILITLTIRDWGLGKFTSRFLDAMTYDPGYIGMMAILMFGGLGGVIAYAFLFMVLAIAMLPNLQEVAAFIALPAGVIASLSYFRGMYLLLKAYKLNYSNGSR